MANDDEREQQVDVKEDEVEQPGLFGAPVLVAEDPKSQVPAIFLTDQSSLIECADPYRQELMVRGKSAYTVTCFLSDLKMFSTFIGMDTPVGRVTKEQLTDWLMKLKFGTDGRVPAPKTMARRVTFLKNFFSWLEQEQLIRENPAASLALERPLPPLPQLLSDAEVQSLLDAATSDVRAQCLIYLVLRGGLKKEEVMSLHLGNIDLTDPQTPLVTVRFAASVSKQHRERRLALPAEFSEVYQEYVRKYEVSDTLFPYTDRNLNYILARIVKNAGIEKRVTLQLLRDTFAVQQLQAGVSFESLQEKMGLSDEAWLESKEKYRRLAFPK
jgi:integrase/recombinase XerD